MADGDLDSLLDEVERKYCRPEPRGKGAACRADGERGKESRRWKTSDANVSTDEEDVDDLIENILDVHIHGDTKAHRTKPLNQKTSKIANQPHSKKCCPVYLGGTMVPFGVGTNISERACSQLRCTSCDSAFCHLMTTNGTHPATTSSSGTVCLNTANCNPR